MVRKAAILALLGSLLCAGLAGAVGYGQVASAATSTANLWVDTNGGTCTRAAVPAAYSDAAACSSTAAAQVRAQAGDTVLLAAGTYPQQSVSKAFASGMTTFGCVPGAVLDVPAATDGATAKAFLFANGANRVRLANCELLDGISVENSATSDNIEIVGNYVHSTCPPDVNRTWACTASYGIVLRMTKAGSHVAILNNRLEDIGYQCKNNGTNLSACDSADNSSGGGLSRGYCIYDFASKNLTVTGNHIKGCWEDAYQAHATSLVFTDNDISEIEFGGSGHQDGIQIFTANPVSADIERNNFHGNIDTGIRIQNVDHTGYKLINNVVAGTVNTGFDLEHLHSSTVSYNTLGVERYQSHIQADSGDAGASAPSNDIVENNIVMPNRTGGCAWRLDGTGHTYRNNDLVRCSATCPGCIAIAPTFVNATMGADMRLKAGSAGIDRGVLLAGVATDLGGRPRVVGPAPDMGAWERQATDP